MFYTPQSTRTGTESPAIASRSQSIMSTTSNQVQVRPQITVSDVLLMDVVMMGREGGIQLLEYQNVIRNVVIVDDPTVSLPCPVVLQIDSIGVQLSAGRLTALSPVLSIPMCAITKLQTFVEWNMLGMCGLKLCGPDGFVCLLGLTDGRMRSALHKVIAIRSGALLPQRPTTPGRASSTSQQKPSSRANTPSASRGPSKSPSRVIVSSKKTVTTTIHIDNRCTDRNSQVDYTSFFTRKREDSECTYNSSSGGNPP
eukprot:PhF_6_TR5654/c1_g1_i2/m.8285